MKKLLVLALFVMLFGCSKMEDCKVLVPNGTPFLAIGNISELTIENVNGPDLLSAAFVNPSSPYDMIIAPVNLGAKLYISGASTYKLAAVITTNNNYIVCRNDQNLASINDLMNQEIMAYGQNSTPGIALTKALSDNGVTANITYKTSVNDIIPFFMGNDAPDYILTAEPTLSNLNLKYGITDLKIIDLKDVLDVDILQAGIFVKSNFDNYQILDLIKENVEFLNDNPNAYANEIVPKNTYFENMGLDLIIESIPKSSIEYLEASLNQEKIISYFNTLNTYNTNLLSGVLPNEEFYYQK